MKGVMSLKKPQTTQGTVDYDQQSRLPANALNCPCWVVVPRNGGAGSLVLTVDDQSAAHPLRIVRLQDVQDLAALTDAGRRVGTLLAGDEVDEQRERLLARRQQVQHALDHEDKVLDLARAGLRVLPGRVEVVAGAAPLVVAQEDLLARLVLGADVLGGQLRLDAVVAPPRERVEQPSLRALFVPFSCAQVPEEALACQPKPLRVRRRAAGVDLGRGHRGPAARLLQQPVELALLVGRERRPLLRLARRRRVRDGNLERRGGC
jgi:hypothetical protein